MSSIKMTRKIIKAYAAGGGNITNFSEIVIIIENCIFNALILFS